MSYSIDEEGKAKIIDYLDKGVTVSDIAKMLGVHRVTVHRFIKKHKLIPVDEAESEKKARRLDKADISKLIELYQAGTKITDIEKELDISRPTIYYYINREGLVKGRKVDADKVSLAIDLYKRGLEVEEVLRQSGISRATLYRYLKKL